MLAKRRPGCFLCVEKILGSNEAQARKWIESSDSYRKIISVPNIDGEFLNHFSQSSKTIGGGIQAFIDDRIQAGDCVGVNGIWVLVVVVRGIFIIEVNGGTGGRAHGG